MPFASGPSPSYRQVMIFIDGGHLRKYLEEKWQSDEISGNGLQELTFELLGHVRFGNVVGELIRTYYYDAIVGEDERELRQKQNESFRRLHIPFCTVRLGRLKKTEKEGHRQKGVDILMAIDMLTKAYENHYDIAIVVAGDDDFVDLIEAVKDAGKRVLGAFIPGRVSEKFMQSLDVQIPLSESTLRKLVSQAR